MSRRATGPANAWVPERACAHGKGLSKPLTGRVRARGERGRPDGAEPAAPDAVPLHERGEETPHRLFVGPRVHVPHRAVRGVPHGVQGDQVTAAFGEAPGGTPGGDRVVGAVE